jgi:hypothetical protein
MEATAHSGGGYTIIFRFDYELSDFEFTAALDPQNAPGGPMGLQVQAHGLGPYFGFLASVKWPVVDCSSQPAVSQQHVARRRSAEFCSMNSMQLGTIRDPNPKGFRRSISHRLRDDQVSIP